MRAVIVANRNFPYLAVTVGVAIWQGMIGVMVNWIDWPATTTVWARCTVAALVLLPIGRHLHASRGTTTTKEPTPWLAVVGSGLLLAGHWTTLFWGYRVADVGPVIVAVYTFPMMAALLEPWLFGGRLEPRGLRAAAWVVLGILAMRLLDGEHQGTGHDNGLGIMLGICSAALYTARNLLSRKLVPKVGVIRMMGLQAAVVSIVLLPSLAMLDGSNLHARDVGLLLLFGIAFTAVPHALLIWAFQRLSVAAVGIVGSIEVVSGVVMAWVWLGEPIQASVALGAVGVIAGVGSESVAAWRRGVQPTRRQVENVALPRAASTCASHLDARRQVGAGGDRDAAIRDGA